MNKKVKTIVLPILGRVIVLSLVSYAYFILFFFSIILGDQITTSSPENVVRRVGFKLPEYEIVEYDDNLDRSASAWSSKSWELRLKEPLTEKHLKKLNNLLKKKSWVYDEETKIYKCRREGEGEEMSIYVTIDTQEGNVIVFVMWWDVLS